MKRFSVSKNDRSAAWRLAVIVGVAAAMLVPAAAMGRVNEPIATGTVTDSNTMGAIEDAWVNAYRIVGTDWYWAGEAYTDTWGEYTVYDTEAEGAGNYGFVAESYSYIAQDQYDYWDGASLLNNVDFELDWADPIASGKVTDATTGSPIGDAYISAAWFDGDAYLWTGDAYTAPDGSYTVYDSYVYGAGQYEFYAEAPGYAAEAKYANWGGTNQLTVNFALSDVYVVGIAGANRIATAIEVSKEAFPYGAEDVVIATGYNWPDALGGSALAGALDGPILLTRQDRLPSEVLAEITRLKAKSAVILGSTKAVSLAVENSLKAKLGPSNVTRLGGANRYETARLVAVETVRILKLTGGYGRTAFVATGGNFPDALGASPLAAAKGWPIFLVNPRTGIDAATIAAMQSIQVEGALILGDARAVSETSKNIIKTSVPCVTLRLAGANRFDTAVAVASYGVAHAGLGWDALAIATGTNFPDALAGGVLQGRSGSVLLLTPTNSLNASVAATLSAHKDAISEVRFLGDTNAVSNGVRTAVVNALK